MAVSGGLSRYSLWLGVIAAVVLAVPAEATAAIDVTSSGGFKYVRKSFQLEPGGPRTMKAPCPRGTHVLAGGHYNGSGFGNVIGAHSFPYDGKDRRSIPDDGWAAQLRALSTSTHAEVHATCSRLAAQYFQSQITVPDNPDSTPFVAVDCDPPTLSLAGGGTRGDPLVREVSGAPLDGNTWVSEVVNKSGNERQVTGFGICVAHPLASPSVFSDSSAAAGIQSNSTMGCAPATPHLVGGFHSLITNTGKSEMAIASTHPSNIKPGPDEWKVWLDNYGTQPMQYRVTTRCSASLN